MHDSDGRDPAWASAGTATCVADVDVEDLYMHEAVDTASDVGGCDPAMSALSLGGASEDEATEDEQEGIEVEDDCEDATATAEVAGADEEDEEEEDYYSVTIPLPEGDKEFFTNDASSGEICEITSDGDIGDAVGHFVGGCAVFS